MRVQVAGDLGVNLNTVAAAYRELQEEQLIAIKPGSGAKVASRTAVRRPEELTTSLRTALLNLISGSSFTNLVIPPNGAVDLGPQELSGKTIF